MRAHPALEKRGAPFGDLTIEGENRVRIQFERPELRIDLDPRQAPGLDLGSAMDVLDAVTSGIYYPGGWLHTELRGNQLVYVVHAYNFTGYDTGYFGLYAATYDEALDQAMEIIDLHAEGFDPVMGREERAGYHTPGENEAPVRAHLDRVLWAEGIVFVYPTWWYGQPAMLKGWLEADPALDAHVVEPVDALRGRAAGLGRLALGSGSARRASAGRCASSGRCPAGS